jgi:transposase
MANLHPESAMRRPLPEIRESLEELKALLGRTKDPKRKQRIHLLVLLRSGQARSRGDAATHLGVHRNSVQDWLARYERGGLEAMLEIGTPGARPGQRVLAPAVLKALTERLKGEGFQSYGEVRQWLEREFGSEHPYGTVYGLVRFRLGGKLKRSRPQHVKKTSSRPPTSPGA